MFRKNGHFPNLSGWNASNHWYGETTEWTTRLCKCLQIIPTSVFQMMYISPYQPFEKRFPPGATGRFHDHFGNLNGRWSWEDPKDVLLYGCDLEEYFFLLMVPKCGEPTRWGWYSLWWIFTGCGWLWVGDVVAVSRCDVILWWLELTCCFGAMEAICKNAHRFSHRWKYRDLAVLGTCNFSVNLNSIDKDWLWKGGWSASALHSPPDDWNWICESWVSRKQHPATYRKR